MRKRAEKKQKKVKYASDVANITALRTCRISLMLQNLGFSGKKCRGILSNLNVVNFKSKEVKRERLFPL